MNDGDNRWRPEPKPNLMMSIGMRYRIRPSAKGWALFDHALGERVSDHRTKLQALRHKAMHQTLLKALRDSVRMSA